MKEDYAIVLEYLPNGYALENKRIPIIQAIGEDSLILLELIPKKGVKIDPEERVYIGEGKREKISYISERLKREKLTESAKNELKRVISQRIDQDETRFLKFFNESVALNKRMHQLELLPGLGKKYVKEILREREIEKFSSFENLRKRIPNLQDPKKILERRIFKELTEFERYNLLI